MKIDLETKLLTAPENKPEQNKSKAPIRKSATPINKKNLYLVSYVVAGLLFGLLGIGFFNKYSTQANYDKEVKGVETQVSEISSSEENEQETVETIEKSIVLKSNPPQINAKSYGVYYLDADTNTFKELHTQNPELSLPPASITKIMTAIVAMEKYNLDMEVKIPANCVNLNGSSVGFSANEVFTLEDLLYGLLVRSGADAACAIANITNEQEFIETMNRKADELGMTKTSFANEIGFDAQSYQFSSVSDLKIMSEHALKYRTFQKIVGTRFVTISEINSGKNYTIYNTNDLLSTIPGTVGTKTGYTEDAGECLSYLYENKGQEIMIIILGSQDRFGDTSRLLDWAKSEIAL